MIRKLLFIRKFKTGDWLIITLSSFLIVLSMFMWWDLPDGKYIEIEKGQSTLGTYSINQDRIILVDGQIGQSQIEIKNGKARIKKSPCRKQYCVHQGWVNKKNQMVVCLPNYVTLFIIGDKKNYDSINY